MRTIHLTSRQQLAELTTAIEEMLDGGKRLAVTVAEEDELLSPNAAAERLGFSRQHVRRLVDAGELAGRQLPRSRYWKVPLSSILAFEERRERAAREADEFASGLERLGAPAE
jgi:excisionase family DNA binding protein